MMGQLQICEAHVRHPCDADMGLSSWLPHGRENTLRIKTGKEKNEMKQRKTIAALSLLLAGCICLSACGGGKPSSSFYKYMRMIVFLSSPTRKCT